MKSIRNFSLSILSLLLLSLSSCDDSLISPSDDSSVFSLVASASGDGVKVAASSLPAAISTYLNANYPGKTITKAEKYLTKFEVTLSDLTKLEFSLSGAFIEVSGSSKNGTKTSDDPQVALPQVILDYIAKNYPGVGIYKAEKSSNKYEVKLSNRVRLDFDLNGNLIRVKTW